MFPTTISKCSGRKESNNDHWETYSSIFQDSECSQFWYPWLHFYARLHQLQFKIFKKKTLHLHWVCAHNILSLFPKQYTVTSISLNLNCIMCIRNPEMIYIIWKAVHELCINTTPSMHRIKHPQLWIYMRELQSLSPQILRNTCHPFWNELNIYGALN